MEILITTSFLQIFQGPDDRCKRHRSTGSFGDGVVYRKFSIRLLPVICNAHSVLGSLVLVGNMFVSKPLISPKMPIAMVS